MDKLTNKRHKILAVASQGGHWTQLRRITDALESSYDIAYIGTIDMTPTLPAGSEMQIVPDFSRWDAWRIFPSLWQTWRIVGRLKPRAIITTGAAPGLVAILVGRLRGVRTLWIDSIANAETLSGSGKMARRLAHRIFTQWPHLADNRVEYHGNTLGI